MAQHPVVCRATRCASRPTAASTASRRGWIWTYDQDEASRTSSSGRRTCSKANSRRSSGPKASGRPPRSDGGGSAPGPAATSGLPTISASSSSQASGPVSSPQTCQPSPSQPPGRSTRAHWAPARVVSNQCQAWATSTASARPSGRASSSAGLATTSTRAATSAGRSARDRRSAASMPSEGSTATTWWPKPARVRVAFPVPAPISMTRRDCPAGGEPMSQSTVASGHGARTRSYADATSPKAVRLASMAAGSACSPVSGGSSGTAPP